MPGFHHDPLADVQAIRQLLEGYKTGYPFLKEALQNAQDAGATKVWFQWHRGLGPQSRHPLLRDPALIIVNDGPFDEKSRHGISVIGLSNRAADAQRIGRFGLGIKSLFHVCEGFFYMESDEVESLRGFLTPWHASEQETTRHHKEWWTVDPAEWQQMAQEITHALPKTFTRWFALWIPLRTATSYGGIESIRTECPGVSNDRCDPGLTRAFETRSPSLAEAMIFLDQLISVEFHDGHKQQFSFKKDTGDGGADQVIGDAEIWTGRFKDSSHRHMNEIAANKRWPVVSDRDTGAQKKDKVSWEGGVAVSLSPARCSSPALSLFWSVFLPVGNTPAFEVPLSRLGADLNIFIHGYFFPDRDRTRVLGAESGFEKAGTTEEEALKEKWNSFLATSADGVLQKLLPTLERCFATKAAPDEVIEEIIGGLCRSNFFKTYRTAICQDITYAKVLTRRHWAWQREQSHTRLLAVPLLYMPADGLELILLEVLAPASAERVVVIEGQPRLCRQDLSMDWDAADLSWFCKALKPEALRESSDARGFVSSLLAHFHSVADACREAWQTLPLYSVQLPSGRRRIVSREQLGAQHQTAAVFQRDTADWAQWLHRGCPKLEFWLIHGTSPPDILPPVLNARAAAVLVQGHPTLAAPVDRQELLGELLKHQEDPIVCAAVRYLLHGSFPHREDSGTLHFCPSNNAVAADQWGQMTALVLNKTEASWRAVPADFADCINPQQEMLLEISRASADAFRKLCSTLPLDLSALPLAPFHDFLMRHLEGGIGDEDLSLLRRLKIHSYGQNQFTVVDEEAWLAPDHDSVPPVSLAALWGRLCQQAHIVARAGDPRVVEQQKGVFGPQVLDTNGIICRCCSQLEPEAFAPLIVFCLGKGNPNAAAREKLVQTSWLPVRDGPPARLDQLLWIEGAEDELDELLRTSPAQGYVVTRRMLTLGLDERENRGAWNTLATQLIAKGEEVLTLLELAFESSSKTHLGIPLASLIEVEEWLAATAGIEDDFARGASRLISRLWQRDKQPDLPDARAFAQRVASIFARPWMGHDSHRYDSALEALRQRHQQVEVRQHPQVAAVFCRYLEQAFKTGCWERHRLQNDFSLLNQNGEWKFITDLVRPCPGLHSAWMLDAAQSVALDLRKGNTGKADQLGELDITESARATASLLKTFGEHLPDLAPRCWGAFVALMGDDEAVRQLAEELTQDVEGFRSGLVPDEDLRGKLSELHFLCTLQQGNSAEMQALSGRRIQVPLSAQEGSFLIPDPHGRLATWEIRGDKHFHRLRLLAPKQFRHLNQVDLQQRLERSIGLFLAEVLNYVPSHLGGFFHEVSKLEDSNLGLAQQTILIGAETHLQQLSWKALKHSGLTEAFNELKESKHFEALALQQELTAYAGEGAAGTSRRKADEHRKKGLLYLRNVLREDSALHAALSDSMRRRIGGSGYLEESVPFELFQNADDAVGELPHDAREAAVFVAEFHAEWMRFAHWGRPINQVTGTGADWMQQDLVKMILLNGSDKGVDDAAPSATGKFGLGFKSVHLVCDRPRIISGSLEFEILGATYPARLLESEAKALSKWLKEQTPGTSDLRNGTAFELRLNGGKPCPDVFQSLAAYLPLFARHMKELRIKGEAPVIHRWLVEHRLESETCVIETGSVTGTGRLLRLSSRTGPLSWVFGWEGGHLHRLPASLPCLWITVPTRARPLGLLLNGPFEADPGRSGLGSGAEAARKNGAVFATAANLLAEGLKLLYSERGRDEILSGEVGVLPFWKSAWELFVSLPEAATNPPAAHDEVIRAVWTRGCVGGYSSVIASHRVIHNGLPGILASLTSMGQISYRMTGYLEHASGMAFLDHLGTSPAWVAAVPRRALEPSRMAAAHIVAAIQKHLGEGAIRTDAVTLPFILRSLLPESRVTVEAAGLLGAHLSEPTFHGAGGYLWSLEEEKHTRDYLESLQFLNADGNWIRPQEMLSSAAPGHEPGRAAFAPATSRLAAEYVSYEAQDFFRLCRGDMAVDAEEMAAWIRLHLDNEDSPRVSAALNFLASGDDVASSCAEYLSLAEQNTLLDCDEFWALELQDQNRIKHTFNIAGLQQAKRSGAALPLWDEVEYQQEELGFAEPTVAVRDLIEEWSGNEAEAVELFTLSGRLRPLVFPDLEGDDNLRARLLQSDNIVGKAAWYRLLCLGCALSLPLGRTPYDRVIRFWNERLGDGFWRATIPKSVEEGASPKFEQQLDTFFEDIIHRTFRDENASGEDADFWRRVFYDFRKMHFFVFGEDNLPALILEIAGSDGVAGDHLVQFLRSGHVPAALQTPGHERWAGVVGQSMSAPLLFVMRELRRLGVLPAGFESTCYYMNSPARRVAARLDWIDFSQQRYSSFAGLLAVSEEVCRKVQDEAPELLPYFDLPLQWFAHQNL